jgi:hypothetical protein
LSARREFLSFYGAGVGSGVGRGRGGFGAGAAGYGRPFQYTYGCTAGCETSTAVGSGRRRVLITRD